MTPEPNAARRDTKYPEADFCTPLEWGWSEEQYEANRALREYLQETETMQEDTNAERREALIRRVCGIMGWEYHTSPVWTGLRKVALAEAVPMGLDKLEEIANRLEELERCPPRRPQWESMVDLFEEND